MSRSVWWAGLRIVLSGWSSGCQWMVSVLACSAWVRFIDMIRTAWMTPARGPVLEDERSGLIASQPPLRLFQGFLIGHLPLLVAGCALQQRSRESGLLVLVA